MTATYNHTLSGDILHKREDGAGWCAGGADGRDDWRSDDGIGCCFSVLHSDAWRSDEGIKNN